MQRRFALPDEGADLGQDQKRRPERGEIAAIGQSHGNPASQTLQVINGLKTGRGAIPAGDASPGSRKRRPDLSRIRTGSRSGIVEPAAEPPPPHGGHRLIEDMKKRSRLFPLGDRREEFEVPLGDLVQDQMGAAFIPGQIVDVAEERPSASRPYRQGRRRRRRPPPDGFPWPVPRAFPAGNGPEGGCRPLRVESFRRKTADPAALPLAGNRPDQVFIAEDPPQPEVRGSPSRLSRPGKIPGRRPR